MQNKKGGKSPPIFIRYAWGEEIMWRPFAKYIEEKYTSWFNVCVIMWYPVFIQILYVFME